MPFHRKDIGRWNGGDAACFLSPACVHKKLMVAKSMQNGFLHLNETTSPLEVIECHIREADGSVYQEAQAGFPCDLQRTARTGDQTSPHMLTASQMYIVCVSLHVQVNETKLDLELIN